MDTFMGSLLCSIKKLTDSSQNCKILLILKLLEIV